MQATIPEELEAIEKPPTVRVATGQITQPKHAITLPLPSTLKPEAKKAFVLDQLPAGTLLSLGQLCDDDCIAVFTKYDVQILKEGQIIIKGKRTPSGLWTAATTCAERQETQPDQQVNGIVTAKQTKQELARYLHACAFSPTVSTWKKAITKGHFASWPGLTEELITKHFAPTDANSLGHMKAKKRSTKRTNPNATPPAPDPFIPNLDFEPTQEENNDATHNLFATMWETDERTYSDQTGQFPVESTRGNKYIFIVYSYDSNAIMCTAIKSRQARAITAAWVDCYKRLQMSGYAPKLHILDNEFSTIIKEAFDKYTVKYQTVAPYKHRVNAAERAIQTFKDHFIAGLATCDPEFPIKEWDRLLPQAEITLNLLRSSRRQPHLSAYEAVWGKFDFTRTPLAPPGTKAIVYEPTQKRTTFGFHGKLGWYVGPALTKYKHYTFYIPRTHREQECDTMEWKPTNITFPHVSTTDYLKQALTDITTVLQQMPKLADIQLEYGDETNNAWVKLADLLKQAATKGKLLNNQKDQSQPLQRVHREQRVHKPQPLATTPPQPNTALDYDTDIEDEDENEPRVTIPSTTSTRQKETENPYQKQYATTSLTRRSYRSRAFAQFIQQEDLKMFHIYSEEGKRISYDKLIKGEDKERWLRSSANEFGRLMRGVGKHSRAPHECVAGTDTMRIVKKTDIPKEKPITYGNFVCDYRPLKEEQWRTRLTVGGDKLTYDGDVTAPASQLTEAKLLFNSTISDHKRYGARFATADIKNFYLNNPLQQYQYMKIHQNRIPSEIWKEYEMDQYCDDNGYVYFEIRKGMYGLKEAGIVAWLELVAHMKKHGYEPMRLTTGMWRHTTRKTIFTLTVDDFGIKYCNNDDLQHLLQTLRQKYTITVDMTGSQYCGLTLDWNYDKGYVDIHIPKYIKEALHQLQHKTPNKPVHAPHKWREVAYGRKTQKPTEDEDSPLLDAEGKKRIQRITGKLLFYARAVDHTMLVALNEIARQQANPTQKTMEAANMLLDYAATHPDAKLRFRASDMVLHIDTDAAFLVQPKAKSRIAGYYFMGSSIIRNGIPETELNAPILVQVKTIRYTVGSAAEAEIGGIYDAGQTAVAIRQALEEMGHLQPATPIKTDNATAKGILTATMRPKMSKSIDKNYWWMKDKVAQGEYNLYWKSGRENWADYHTKHHPPTHHKMMRKRYLVAILQRIQDDMRGCVSKLGEEPSHHGYEGAHGTALRTALAQYRTVPMTVGG